MSDVAAPRIAEDLQVLQLEEIHTQRAHRGENAKLLQLVQIQ